MREFLMAKLWNGAYFSDWYDYKRHDYFPSRENFLAIMFDLVDKEKANMILYPRL